MHNLKEIRKNFSKFAKSLEKRSVNVDFVNLEKLDELNRELIQKKESLENEKKKFQNLKMKVYLKNLKKFPLN
jgi:seryl-tRNA synthetase